MLIETNSATSKVGKKKQSFESLLLLQKLLFLKIFYTRYATPETKCIVSSINVSDAARASFESSINASKAARASVESSINASNAARASVVSNFNANDFYWRRKSTLSMVCNETSPADLLFFAIKIHVA